MSDALPPMDFNDDEDTIIMNPRGECESHGELIEKITMANVKVNGLEKSFVRFESTITKKMDANLASILGKFDADHESRTQQLVDMANLKKDVKVLSSIFGGVWGVIVSAISCIILYFKSK